MAKRSRNPASVKRIAMIVRPAIDQIVWTSRSIACIRWIGLAMCPSRLVDARRAEITWMETRRIYANRRRQGQTSPVGPSRDFQLEADPVDLKGCRTIV